MILTGIISELVRFFVFYNCAFCFILVLVQNFVRNLWSILTLNCNGVFVCASASMARKIYIRGGLGVGAFQRIYGGSQRNGSRHLISARAVVLLLVTFFNNCRT
jgi:hypothetical protein